MVKHEDVDEENAQENFYYNMADTEDSSEVPGREESDDNNGKLNTWAYLTIFSGNFAFLNIRVIYFPEGEFVESNAMRMNAASALTFGPNRSGVKDVQGTVYWKFNPQFYIQLVYRATLPFKLTSKNQVVLPYFDKKKYFKAKFFT